MSVSPRAAALIAVVSAGVLLLPVWIIALAVVALIAIAVTDALSVRRAPPITRELPDIVARGVPASLTIRASTDRTPALRLRQSGVPDIGVDSPEADDKIETAIVGRRRGRHALPPVGVRSDGPLGLGRWHHLVDGPRDVLVYPDLPAARRLVLGVRRGRFREAGRSSRAALGLGTEFERVRDYLPDDDIRQVNWLATARLGRPMSNEYRLEQDRDVLCLIDTGRLMGAPMGDLTRLDSAVDAATAVAMVADEVGDRCGVLAFDSEIRRKLSPRRSGASAVVEAIFDLEPTLKDSDYELAFRSIGNAKRGLALVFTDLLDESAAQVLLDAVPVISGRHFVVIATTTDTDLLKAVSLPPVVPHEVYAASVAVDVLDERARVAALLRRAGADVLEAPPRALGAACVRAYLSAKARARL